MPDQGISKEYVRQRVDWSKPTQSPKQKLQLVCCIEMFVVYTTYCKKSIHIYMKTSSYRIRKCVWKDKSGPVVWYNLLFDWSICECSCLDWLNISHQICLSSRNCNTEGTECSETGTLVETLHTHIWKKLWICKVVKKSTLYL